MRGEWQGGVTDHQNLTSPTGNRGVFRTSQTFKREPFLKIVNG